jgi:hypothetical protein
MSDPEQVSGDPQQVQDFFKQFHEGYRYYIDQNEAMTDKAFEINKQIISLYERLLLISVGTIGLSITAFITLAGKFGPHISRRPFVLLISLAWASLFVSAIAFSAAITHTIIQNSTLFQHWTKLLEAYHSQMFGSSVGKLSNVLSGNIQIEGQDHDVKKLFAKLSGELREAGNSSMQERLKMLNVGSVKDSPVRKLAIVGTLAMQVGFILLCIAAIKGFLSV